MHIINVNIHDTQGVIAHTLTCCPLADQGKPAEKGLSQFGGSEQQQLIEDVHLC